MNMKMVSLNNGGQAENGMETRRVVNWEYNGKEIKS